MLAMIKGLQNVRILNNRFSELVSQLESQIALGDLSENIRVQQ